MYNFMYDSSNVKFETELVKVLSVNYAELNIFI